MFYLCLLLLISSVDIEYPDSSVAWPLGYDAPLRRGYGQYNYTADFHRALDFHGSVGDLVGAPYPYDGGFWVLRVSTQQDTIIDDSIEGSVLIGRGGPYANYGWHYGHIDVNHPRFLLADSTYFNRVTLSVLVALLEQGSHVHFSWLDTDAYAPSGPHPQHGYFNPIDYLIRYWGLYNKAAFSPTHAGPNGEFASLHGICFAREGVVNICPDQNGRIQDIIDIIVRPYTYYYHNTENDSCIVRRVQWRLVKQDPSTLEYEPYNNNLLGTWRTLYDFSGYIFDDNDIENFLDEYEKIFFGGMQHWSNNICLTNTCETRRSDASFPGVETVWIDPYNRQQDFDDNEYCRGGWDTRFCTSDSGNPAYTDEAASFPDGRYAVEVMAIPQKSPDSTFRTLPVNNITLPRPEVTGIVVDNWAPRITDICFRDNPTETVFDDYYTIIEANDPDSGRWQQSNSPIGRYIGTGEGTNDYSLEISYSEPVIVAPSIPLTIKMFTGPDSSVNWEKELILALDASCLNPAGECQTAIYRLSELGPSGYVGNQLVELEITSGFATDLAGKGLDADAITVATAWGEGGSNCETTHTYFVDHVILYGYYREPGDQGSRSNTLYAYYDQDQTYPYDWKKHYITLTGPLTTAELFHEVNLFSGPDYTRCDIYGGTWMCDWVGEILHVYIVDYLGNIKRDEIVCDFASIPAYGSLYHAITTNLIYPAENPYQNPTCDHDRYGWLAWIKTTPPPEDEMTTRDDDVYQKELNITVYDAFAGSKIDYPVCSGQQWRDSTSGTWYYTCFTQVRPVSLNLEGALEVRTRVHLYPDTTPIDSTYIFYPPVLGDRISDTTNQDNLSSTELTSRGIEIEDYFTVFPNPVVSSLSINFMTSEDIGSTVHIYDISGHLLKTIAEELPGMQNHNIHWDLKDSNGHIVPAGIYYVYHVSGSLTETKTVIVIH